MTKENKDFIKELWVLGLPAGMQLAVTMIVNLIDNLMVGQLGEASITAVSICTTFTWLCSVASMGLANGALIIAAQDWGLGNKRRIKSLMSVLIIMTSAISIIFFSLTSAFPIQILKIYSKYDFILEPGTEYLKYIKYTFFLTGILTSITILMRSARVIKLGFWASLSSCLFNIFFNWVFIFGHLGAPAMGAAGAALGTLIARMVEFLVVIVYAFFIDKNLNYRLSDFNIDLPKEEFVQFLKISAPLFLIEILNNLVTSAQTMITGRISENYISANSITHMAWILPNVFCFGVGMAASIMMGNLLGVGDNEKADRYSKKFVVAAIVLGVISATFVQVLIPILINFYKVSAETKMLAKQMGYITSINVLFISFTCVITDGVIKSGGYTNRLLRLNLIANWLVVIPLGMLIAFKFNGSPLLLYFVLRSGNIIRTIWSIIRLKKGDWKQNIAVAS